MALMRSILILAAFLILLLTASCSDRQDMAGTYRHVTDSVPGNSSVIELRKDHMGTWKTELDRIDFWWNVQGNEILLETVCGKKIAGEITGRDFRIELSRAGSFFFERIDP